jgi:hypothetical protein
VQEAASHVDPRTTMRYDRARTSPEGDVGLAEQAGEPLAPLEEDLAAGR